MVSHECPRFWKGDTMCQQWILRAFQAYLVFPQKLEDLSLSEFVFLPLFSPHPEGRGSFIQQNDPAHCGPGCTCYPDLFPNHFSFSFPFPLTMFFPHENPPRLISASRFSTGLIAPLPISLDILHVPWRPHYACSPATAWNVSLPLLCLFISHHSLVHHRATSISTPSLKL